MAKIADKINPLNAGVALIWKPVYQLTGVNMRATLAFNGLMKQYQERNQAKLDRARNFDICFCVIFDH